MVNPEEFQKIANLVCANIVELLDTLHTSLRKIDGPAGESVGWAIVQGALAGAITFTMERSPSSDAEVLKAMTETLAGLSPQVRLHLTEARGSA